MASHGQNEKFVLIRPDTLREVVLPPAAIGALVSIRPRGLADDEAQAIDCVVTGEALRPPSPIDLSAETQTDGALSLAWTRRSRLGWAWPGADAPLGESAERYRVTVQGSAATLTLEVQEPQVLIPADSLNEMTGAVAISVVQIGDFAESRPVSISISI